MASVLLLSEINAAFEAIDMVDLSECGFYVTLRGHVSNLFFFFCFLVVFLTHQLDQSPPNHWMMLFSDVSWGPGLSLWLTLCIRENQWPGRWSWSIHRGGGADSMKIQRTLVSQINCSLLLFCTSYIKFNKMFNLIICIDPEVNL